MKQFNWAGKEGHLDDHMPAPSQAFKMNKKNESANCVNPKLNKEQESPATELFADQEGIVVLL